MPATPQLQAADLICTTRLASGGQMFRASAEGFAAALDKAGLLAQPNDHLARELAAQVIAYKQDCPGAFTYPFSERWRKVADAALAIIEANKPQPRFYVYHAGGALTASFPWAVLDRQQDGTAICYFSQRAAAETYAQHLNTPATS